jgi:hypothetical protein
MNQGSTIFSQLIAHASRDALDRCIRRYRGNHRVRTFSCRDQFLVMAFAQLTYRESLRDIEACLSALPDRLYHMGIRGNVSRSTLADANEQRDWRIYADFAQGLIAEARRLYAGEPLDLDLEHTVYALDATIIEFCIELFPWARFQKHVSGVKLHTLLDLRGPIPAFARITAGNLADSHILDVLTPEPGSIYVFDRAYLDFVRLRRLNQAKAIFVTRAKKNQKLRRIYSRPVDRSTGLICDQTVVLAIAATARSTLSNCAASATKTRIRQGICLHHQRLRSAGAHDHQALQVTLAHRALLQVDQAAPPDQGVLREKPQRRQHPDLDRHFRVPDHRHRPEAAWHRAGSLHFATDPESLSFRANPARTSTRLTRFRRSRKPLR